LIDATFHRQSIDLDRDQYVAAVPSARAQRGADTTTRIVDHVFDAWRSTDSPGCAVGVSRDGRVVYDHGYGMANLETGTPITPVLSERVEGEPAVGNIIRHCFRSITRQRFGRSPSQLLRCKEVGPRRANLGRSIIRHL